MLVTPKPTPNFRTGRRSPVRGICLHCTEGTAESAISWFGSPKSEVSAHYMVQKDGVVIQFVDEANEAWAQGRVDHPTAQIVADHPGLNPNAYLISIEHEGFGDLTDEQRESSIILIRSIAHDHDLEINRYTVIGHHEVYSIKSCPGKLDVDAHVALAIGTPQPAADHPLVVYSPSLGDYLVVTRYVSDAEWYFTPLKSIVGGTRAGTPLSQMPTQP